LPAELVLPYPAHPFVPAIAVDNLLSVHVAWSTFTTEFYAGKPKGGAWSEPQDISNNDSAFGYPWLGVDDQNNVHCVWASEYHPLNTSQVRYRERFADGTWAQALRPCTLSKVWLDGFAAMGPDGAVVIPGGTWDGDWVTYATKPRNQSFSDTVIVGRVSSIRSYDYRAAVCDRDGYVHVFGLKTGMNTPGRFEDDVFTTEFQLRTR
jgi:hypothetical protein